MDWHRQAAEDDDTFAATEGARPLIAVRRLEDAQDWLRRAAATATHYRLDDAAELMWEAGGEEEALGWWQLLADAGHSSAEWNATRALEAAGRVDEALDWQERRARQGNGREAFGRGAAMLANAGRDVEALAWCSRGIDAGDLYSMDLAVKLLARTGQGDQTWDWYRRAAETGDRNFLNMLVKRSRHPVAEQKCLELLRTLADAGHDECVDNAVRVMRRRDGDDVALAWLLELAANGRTVAFWDIADITAEAGRIDESLTWWQRCADSGLGFSALRRAAETLERSGRLAEALDWYRRAVAAGDVDIIGKTAELFATLSRVEEGVRWCHDTAENFQASYALTSAVEILEMANREPEAANLRHFGWEPDGSTAPPWDSTPSTDVGRLLAVTDQARADILRVAAEHDGAVGDRLRHAIELFRGRDAGEHEKRSAVVVLSGLLEERRDLLKSELLRKDEQELFSVANNFAIRHQNEQQKRDYSVEFLDWIFWWYLATIELTNRLGDR
ncbi:hypothetical protein [Frankia sp. R82]|uniref:hypothetical protein n=1 Tax=Frankia sp. R82 TaxID=2950553 RepID=UPI0020442BA3|nr:hypothetical protein [Frankia sp. R82]MCM3885954.1 hypothetical protein [Frankia sp. R82]